MKKIQMRKRMNNLELKHFPIGRKCAKCLEYKPPTHDYFSTDKRKPDGFDYWCKPCRSLYVRLRKYGITQEEFERKIKAQNNRCAMCGALEDKTSKLSDGWCIDHDHNTGMVRGIICNICNVALGFIESRGDIGAEYLRKYSEV